MNLSSRPVREALPDLRAEPPSNRKPKRELGWFDSTMIVTGSMIGSGIFIVPAAMARTIGSPGWFVVAWIIAGVLTVAAALSYGELASMLPGAGGVYLYLRQAYSPLWGFLYGWTLFTVVQTGTIAALGVAFARFLGVLVPRVSETNFVLPPIHLSAHYALTLSTTQLVALLAIGLLTATNTLGIRYGKLVQNVFTVVKIGALLGLIFVGLILGSKTAVVQANLGMLWHGRGTGLEGVSATSIVGLLVAVCVSQSGSLFAADAWHDITFTAEEVKDPARNLPRSLALGSVLVILLYWAAIAAYLTVLPFADMQHASQDRVATAMVERVFPAWGGAVMALAIMVSTFGCMNSMVLAGARVHYAMARDRLFLPAAGRLNRAHVPGWSLAMQGLWAGLLVLVTTYSPAAGYGNLYSDLLDYIISAALLFYILTVAAVLRLRRTMPGAARPYRAPGYPIVPAIYIVGASAIVLCLFVYRPATTWPGLALVACGLPVYGAIARFQRA